MAMLKLSSVWILLVLSSVTMAEMPELLKGTWVLDVKQTKNNIMDSPKWTPEGEKYLPRILKRMSNSIFLFEDGAITFQGKVKKEAIKVVLKESSKERYVFDVISDNRDMTVTVSFLKDIINIRSSNTDDMDLYLWKRGTLSNNSLKQENKSEAIDLMKSMLNSSNKSIQPTAETSAD